MRTSTVASTLACAALGAAVAAAQTPAGGEFQISTYTTTGQDIPAASARGNGDFAVAWRGQQDGHDDGVFGRLLDAAGATVGPELQVNVYTTQAQNNGTLAGDRKGNVIVVWQSFQDGDGSGVFGRRIDAAGVPRGGEFQINTYTTSVQNLPVIASSPNGTFVVVWTSFQQGDASYGLFGRRLSSSGVPLGAEFHVNTFTTGRQGNHSVAVDAAGRFVVAWESEGQDGSDYGVFARRFDAAGTALGPELQVNVHTPDGQRIPSVASAADGSFVVTWTSNNQVDVGDIFARRYDAAGAPLTGEFRVNAYTTNNQGRSQVSANAAGDFTVVWDSYAQDGSSWGVFAQRYDRTGASRGAEYRANVSAAGVQEWGRVASDAVGNLLIAWSGPSGGNQSILGRRFGGLVPTALAVDAQGNGVLEPGEAVGVRPTWRNVTGAAQSFGALLDTFTGPSGAAYAITDGAGSYGTVANGASAACTDCYAVSVSDPPVRPVTHWDASAMEGIVPDAQGQRKRWLLHVGRSFTDVPLTSPFYRFIETVLHHGITGGCTPTEFCPSDPTTREQMAVFMLVAKEGAGYVPPPCATPVFADVPASSPFCRWIEELARRGVAGGCGSGNYCPSGSVTREQMAVFVLRTFDPTLSPVACGTPVYNDVPASSPFCRWIEELTRRNVVTGCGGGNFCPTAIVTREQLAVFLCVTFGLTLYGP